MVLLSLLNDLIHPVSGGSGLWQEGHNISVPSFREWGLHQ